MSHKVWIQPILDDPPWKRVIHVDDGGRLVHVVKPDHELRPGQTLEQVRDWYAALHHLQVIKP